MLDKKKGFEIAAKKIEDLQKASDYNDFSEINLYRENDFFWTYVSGSESMIKDGYVPGAFFVSVDKTDGHIWTRSEQEKFYTQKSVPELQAA